MTICIKKLRSHPLVFLRLTGVSLKDFETIEQKCFPLWKKRVIESRKISGRPHGLKELENHILCLLIYYRTYTTQMFLGFLFGVDDSCVCRSIKRL